MHEVRLMCVITKASYDAWLGCLRPVLVLKGM